MTSKSDSTAGSSETMTAVDRELRAQAEKDAAERKTLQRAILAAMVFHAVLLIATFPQLLATPDPKPSRAQDVYVVQQVRFKPPAPQRQEIPKRKARRIPIPDPTPDDPEPLEVEIPVELDIELPETDAAVFGIPDAPPAADAFGQGDVLQVGGGVVGPEKIFSPQPRYSEDARRGRIQGVVILEAIIDAMGNVSQVKALKPLPLGLTESAIETVKQWQFKPATLEGEPVAVYLNLLINFSLQ
ncbi:MAG: TonB family protein [Acidobacteriota bacterium]